MVLQFLLNVLPAWRRFTAGGMACKAGSKEYFLLNLQFDHIVIAIIKHLELLDNLVLVVYLGFVLPDFVALFLTQNRLIYKQKQNPQI